MLRDRAKIDFARRIFFCQLIQTYVSLNGPNWKNNTNWLSDRSLTDPNEYLRAVIVDSLGKASGAPITTLEAESNDISFFGIDWSPDGGKLVFVSGRDGDDDIYEGTLVTSP